MFLHSGRNAGVFIGATVTFILACVFFAARIISRFGIVKRPGWDDYTIILAWILAFGMSTAIAFGASKGLGLHKESIQTSWVYPLLVSRYVAVVLFHPTLMVTKSSILLLYLSIAHYPQKFLRIGSYVTLAIVLVGGSVLTFITAFQCSPVQAAYNLTIQNSRCIAIETINLASVPVNIATDLAILILPIPVLTTLPLPMRRKTILILSFVLGVIFVIVVDVARIYYVQLAISSMGQLVSTGPSIHSLEYFYDGSLALLWSAVEVNVAIVCACVPTLKPLVKRWMPKAREKRAHGDTVNILRPPSSSQAGSVDIRRHKGGPRYQQGSTKSQLTISSHLRPAAQTAENQEQKEIPMVCSATAADMEHALPSPQIESATYFGFITMERPKCMLDMGGLESVKYCTLVATILFLEGFLSVMLFAVNGKVLIIKNPIQVTGISSASYGGIVVGPFLGYYLLHHVGFKGTFVTALGVCCIGTLMFWPSGVLHSYPGFITSNVVVGIALALFDISATSFLTLCGPPQFTVSRVLVGQGVTLIGGTLSFLLSAKVFFAHMDTARSMIAIQWTYLVLTLSTALLGLLFYYVPLPEATDSDMRSRQQRLQMYPLQKLFSRIPVAFTTLALAVLAAFCSAGSLVCIRRYIGSFLSTISTSTQTSPNLAALDFNLVLTAMYTIGHFILAFLCLLIPPRLLLLFAFGCGIAFTALLVKPEFHSVNTAQYVVLFFGLFLGPIPNFCFAITLGGMGRWTKLAACLIEMGCGLGASASPFIMLALPKAPNSVQYSFVVVIVLFSTGALFPLYLNLVRASGPNGPPPAWRILGNVFQRN
ncbi:hypothetical protein B0O99DRAFT_692381 [Bisporella sp. PMI_857]|nr:hypothetical protein B0O99DRAFT_692381 [Bisporella sp. PMI_857]